MKKIYLVRHGQSLSNILGTFTGFSDIKLSENGIEQSKYVLEFFKNKQIDEIYSSDLSRAYNTVLPIGKYKDIPVIKTSGLREINGGDWEGQSFESLSLNDEYFIKNWLNTDKLYQCVCPNGESVKQTAERVYKTILDILNNSNAQNIIFASHGFAIRCFLTLAQYNDIKKINITKYPVNCGITIAEYDNGKFNIIESCHTEHLGDNITNLPTGA